MSTGGKPEFHEGFVGGPRVSPLAKTVEEFDFDEVDRRLGNSTDHNGEKYPAEFVDLVGKLFRFTIGKSSRRRYSERMIGRRFCALAWTVNPGLFEGSPSGRQLAEMLGLGKPQALSVLTGRARREFGISNRAQARGWNNGLKMTKGPHEPSS